MYFVQLRQMRLTASTFFATILALLAIAASAGTDVIPNHQAVNQVVASVSTVVLVGVTLNQIWPKLLKILVERFRDALVAKPDPYMLLADAARELYEANTNQMLGKWVRGQTDGSQDEILNWLAYWIAARSVTIYGKRPASTVFEEIPPARFTLSGVEGGAARIQREGQDTYIDLAVKRDAFRVLIPALSDTDMPSG